MIKNKEWIEESYIYFATRFDTNYCKSLTERKLSWMARGYDEKTVLSWIHGEKEIKIGQTASFKTRSNHLYYDDKALPAEIENRTTTTLSFLLNIPAVYSIYLERSRFQLTAGLGIFMRFGLRSPGVKDSDSGWTGSAGEDVKKINEYFWNKPRWLYVTAGGSWLYDLTPQLRAGPVINISIPVGGLLVDKDLQGMLISLGIKICR